MSKCLISEHFEDDIRQLALLILMLTFLYLKFCLLEVILNISGLFQYPTQSNLQASVTSYYRHLLSICKFLGIFLQDIVLLVHEKRIWQIYGYLQYYIQILIHTFLQGNPILVVGDYKGINLLPMIPAKPVSQDLFVI